MSGSVFSSNNDKLILSFLFTLGKIVCHNCRVTVSVAVEDNSGTFPNQVFDVRLDAKKLESDYHILSLVRQVISIIPLVNVVV